MPGKALIAATSMQYPSAAKAASTQKRGAKHACLCAANDLRSPAKLHVSAKSCKRTGMNG